MGEWNRLIVAIDEPPAAERTLEYVSSVASAWGDCAIELAHVRESDPDPQAALAASSARLATAGIPREGIITFVLENDARHDLAKRLLARAAETGAGTLVVGWDSCVRPTERLHRHLGERLAARARDVSLWIVRRGMSSEGDLRILAALDESEESQDTIAYLGNVMGASPGTRVRLYRALEPVAPSPADYDDEAGGSTQDVLEAAARERLERARTDAMVHLEMLRDRLCAAGVADGRIDLEVSDAFVRPTDVPEAIACAARDAGCATVVVGCHALTWYERLFRRHVGAELLDATRDLTLWIPA